LQTNSKNEKIVKVIIQESVPIEMKSRKKWFVNCKRGKCNRLYMYLTYIILTGSLPLDDNTSSTAETTGLGTVLHHPVFGHEGARMAG
jgi:hypothetical protein